MACLRSEARSYRFVPLTPKGKGGHLHFALQNKVVHPIFPQTHFPNKFDKLFQCYNSQGIKSSYMKSCYAYCTYTRLSLIRADNSTLLSEYKCFSTRPRRGLILTPPNYESCFLFFCLQNKFGKLLHGGISVKSMFIRVTLIAALDL
jgi:hypothetical protein